ncbi:Gibberellin 3-beta-dioxygenase 1 [Heracleum sosnowskyi]|uniref:gibberellin 3beta-dioxygenase n=1 Tax=Heracleum sosnowskyi TaxID=360622 RepID=A0AAD8M7X5_9APIA|nr:Gibberellin 3-beta-dioxygenase 1 [Heracleum sosnowskyi]
MHTLPQSQNQYLDLNSIKELPESYTWTSLQDDCTDCLATDTESLSIIDLNDPDVLALVRHACKTWGVLQIRNHGISLKLLENMEAAASKLFSLPMEQKLKVSPSSTNDTSGYRLPTISPFFPKLMWREGFTIFGSPVEHALKLWPHDSKSFCDLVEEYKEEMKKLAGRLMWLMLESLGITEVDIDWAGREGKSGGEAVIQLNSYPVCPDPDRAMGLAAHTDSSLLTILHQNKTSGLQIFKEGTGWLTVQPQTGVLVVNIGDLMHILSNGLYPTVLHRALVNGKQQRISVAYIYGPPANVHISPLPKLVDQYHLCLYRPVTWSEYLELKSKHFRDTLSVIRIAGTPNVF